MPKKIILPVLFIISYTITHAQYAGLIGTWKSTGETLSSLGSINNTIQISDVTNEGFIGTKTSEINNGTHTKITVTITGAFRGRGFYLQDGDILQKEPAAVQWPDCSECSHENKFIISRDSLLLVDSISDCSNGCNGVTVYYRLLSEYDSATQRHLADRFGRPADIIAFRPFVQHSDTTANTDNEPANKNVAANTTAINADAIRKQVQQDSLDNIARIKQQQTERSAMIAQQKKRQQEITDSLNLVQQKEKHRVRDSLENAVKMQNIRKRTEDSLRDAEAKTRKKEIADSLNIAKQKKQQLIKDSLDNIARIRQQQINDSTILAQQKKREREITDSLNLVKQKEQQRIKDSLDNIVRIRQQQTEDSTHLVQQKKREQQIADSLNLVNQRNQQRIKDSLENEVAIKLQKQRTADSIAEVQARKRQQEITDSLAIVRKQQYNDSLQKAALAKTTKTTADTTQPAANKALTSRNNVLLQTYHITTPDILIELFDNGEIDGDRVSVYHNNELIVNNQTLGIKPITLNVHADTTNREHEFVLVAENLGSIPPNSALMRITVGKDIYKLSVNTDMKTNARIVFYYDGN